MGILLENITIINKAQCIIAVLTADGASSLAQQLDFGTVFRFVRTEKIMKYCIHINMYIYVYSHSMIAC